MACTEETCGALGSSAGNYYHKDTSLIRDVV